MSTLTAMLNMWSGQGCLQCPKYMDNDSQLKIITTEGAMIGVNK